MNLKMKKKCLWLISVIPLLITAAVLKDFPDSVPMHYNAAGVIDRWGSKYEELIFPVVIILFNIFWQCFLGIFEKKQRTAESDRERQEAGSNIRQIFFSALLTLLLFCAMDFFFLYSGWLEAAAGSEYSFFPIQVFSGIGLGLLSIFLGNLMPKIKRNSFSGLRTPWSMANDRTWAASQRVAGRLMILSGMVILAVSVFWDSSQPIFAAAMCCLTITTAASVFYSYLFYKKYGREAE